MKIFTYFRSSATYRLRIALNLKGLTAESVYIHLRREEQSSPAYLKVNPLGLIPALEHDGHHLAQSLSIIEYLEEIWPEPPLLPRAPLDRAFVRGIAMSIACDIHPLNNLRVLNYLKSRLGVAPPERNRWYAHWIEAGFTGLEAQLSTDARVGRFCWGDSPTLADICLVPQLANAERMHCNLDPFPTLRRLVATARELPSFRAAAPEHQADAEPK